MAVPDELDEVRSFLVKRGLFRLNRAKAAELAAHAGVTVPQVEGLLAGRGDLVGPPGPDGTYALLAEGVPVIRAEITAAYREIPGLLDLVDPRWEERLRGTVAPIEELQAEIDAYGPHEWGKDYMELRLKATAKALRSLAEHGRDASGEERRLAACRAWFDARVAADGGGRDV